MTRTGRIGELRVKQGLKHIKDYEAMERIFRLYGTWHFDTMAVEIERYGGTFLVDLLVYLDSRLKNKDIKSFIFHDIGEQYHARWHEVYTYEHRKRRRA
jgi:hypothetical protein